MTRVETRVPLPERSPGRSGRPPPRHNGAPSPALRNTRRLRAAVPVRRGPSLAPDSIEFHLARAKVRAEQGLPRGAGASVGELVTAQRYAEEPCGRSGLAHALPRQ